ncbi:tRNA(5-methylaminomethyl-2-thiouridylate) methyltransferase [Desulfovibrio sp. OttesenSCG-928-F07]|nr:tRNA(5-methylaminomethyl-2-thiouridylate) methyltransferase [Desulfovibrio sp. OttesenSCG-928-F07]
MQRQLEKSYDGIALFSGGLDSILAARVLMEQGLNIKCVHFVSPFFGEPNKLDFWRREYGLDIDPVDIADEYVTMLRNNPAHGVGSVLNPCVDCKILMMRRAVQLLPVYGATFLVSGEVLGQRPMSQRRDTLNIIRRDGGVKELLLRPLCAKHLDPTPMETSGLVDREKLYDFSGRGRKGQLALAAELGIKKIPTPGGGCLLTEKENSRSFWPVLKHTKAGAGEFYLALTGRQRWSFDNDKAYWLCVGRDKNDNAKIQELADVNDITFKVKDYPGPLALARQITPWPEHMVKDAAAFAASFSNKAVAAGGAVKVRVHEGAKGLDGPGYELEVVPSRTTAANWQEYQWLDAKSGIKEELHKK